jgi:hypothetical protein
VRHRKRHRNRRRPVDLDLSSPPIDLSKMNAPVIYQVDLYGPFAEAYDPHLTNMVRLVCCKCYTKLRAEGGVFDHVCRVAVAESRPVLTLCPACFREFTGIKGPLVGRIPRDPEHEAEVTAALAVMRARKENGP